MNRRKTWYVDYLYMYRETLTGYRRLYLCDRFSEQKMAEIEDRDTHRLENNGYYSSISLVSVIQILANYK